MGFYFMFLRVLNVVKLDQGLLLIYELLNEKILFN